MGKELVAPKGLVYEHFGLTQAPTFLLPARTKVDIRRLNITDPGPAQGRWIDRDALIMWMGIKSVEQGGVAILEDMIRELREATA
jgi:hypothetical protein